MEKGHENKKQDKKAGLKKYEKPKVTVVKLQIEERLMACTKLPSSATCRTGGKRQS